MNRTNVLDEARMQPAVAWAAFRKVLANPEDTPRVFELIRAMAGPSLRRGLARLRDTAFGRRALRERPILLHRLQDRRALAALPAGSLGRAYHDFVYGEHLSADELVVASQGDEGYTFSDPDLRWFRERLRDQHDLWHTVTQYGRNPFGEACLLAFTYAQMRNRGVGLLVLGGGWRLAKAMGPRVLVALWQGFQAGCHANWLPAEDWERLLALPVEDVRRLLAVRPPSVYWEVSAAARAHSRGGAPVPCLASARPPRRRWCGSGRWQVRFAGLGMPRRKTGRRAGWGPMIMRGLALTWTAGAGVGWAAPGGLYFGADLGGAMPGELSSTRINVGVPTNCDQWLGAAALNDGTMVPLPAAQCQPRALPASPSDFDLDVGVFGAMQVGYAFDAVRLEAEVFRRRQSGERLPLVVPNDPKQAEFTERSEAIGAVVGDGFFANAYRDLGARGGKFEPFVGIGFGWMNLDIDYAATSIRNADPAALLALGRNPNAAGLVSRADATVSDNLAAYQVLAGFDYALGQRRALSVKVRYANLFDDFEDGGKAWRPLRGHASTVAPGGAPIRYGIETDDLGFWALTVGLKFHPK